MKRTPATTKNSRSTSFFQDDDLAAEDKQLKTQDDIMQAIISRYNPVYNHNNIKAGEVPHAQGMERIAKELIAQGCKGLGGIRAPERKLVVMIIGNHSAGKSSFINWYVDEEIQKAKVSIETIEVNLIMHGNNRQEFNGFNAIKMDLIEPERKQERFPGLLENMTLKASPSTSRHFQELIFIDTPGLADGNLKYKFNIEGTLEWFAAHCDMVMVFFDPQGQALCKRTMALIKGLYPQCPNKLQFVMTKGDVFDTEEDRMKCMQQITQSLSTVIPPMHGFQMPIVYIPSHLRAQDVRPPVNQIQEVVEMIGKKTKVKAQSVLSNFKRDTSLLDRALIQLKTEQKQLLLNRKPAERLIFTVNLMLVLASCLMVLSLVDLVAPPGWSGEKIESTRSVFHLLAKFIVVAFHAVINVSIEQLAIREYTTYIFAGSLILIPCLYMLSIYLPKRFMIVEPEQRLKKLEKYHVFVMKTKQLYKRISQSLADQVFDRSASFKSALNDSRSQDDSHTHPSLSIMCIVFESLSEDMKDWDELVSEEEEDDDAIEDSKISHVSRSKTSIPVQEQSLLLKKKTR